MVLIFDLLVIAFFGLGELFVCHSELCRLVSGSYSKNPSFITCYVMFENIFVIFDAFKQVQAHIPSVFLLFSGENFWDQLGTNFLHAQFKGQNFVDSLAIQIQHATDHSDCQTPIRPHEIPHFGHIFVRFDVQGLPERCSSSTLSRPSKNALCHLKTCVLDRACSP